MNTVTSTLSQEVENIIIDFENAFGFGICGAYSAILRNRGWGHVAITTATTANGTEFGHYVIVTDDGIIDMTNPFDDELSFSEIEILGADEMPELVDAEVIDWIQERI